MFEVLYIVKKTGNLEKQLEKTNFVNNEVTEQHLHRKVCVGKLTPKNSLHKVQKRKFAAGNNQPGNGQSQNFSHRISTI